MASAKCAKCRPLGHAANTPERSGATPVFIHTYGRGQMKSRNATYLHRLYVTGFESSGAREMLCSKCQLDKNKSHQQLTSAPFTSIYTTIQQQKKPPSKDNFSAGRQIHVSLSPPPPRIKPEGSFRTHKSPELEYRSRCSYKTMGWTVRVSYPGRGESFFSLLQNVLFNWYRFPHWW